MTDLQKSYAEALTQIGTVLYLLLACGIILGIAIIYHLIYGGSKVKEFKPFDAEKERKWDDHIKYN